MAPAFAVRTLRTVRTIPILPRPARARRALGAPAFVDGWRLVTLFAAQDPRPVEFDLRVAGFDVADRIRIERRAADTDAGRRSEPIKDAGPHLPPEADRLDDERVLVPAFVFAEAEMWQNYFPLRDVPEAFFAAPLAAVRGAAFAAFFTGAVAFFGAGFVAVRFAGAVLDAFGVAAFAAAALRDSGAFCTNVNRVWSPIV